MPRLQCSDEIPVRIRTSFMRRAGVGCVLALQIACAGGARLAPDYDKRAPRRVAVLPFDAAVLVPEGAPASGARFAAQALIEGACSAATGAAVAEAMRESAVTDPGQARCCVPDLTRRLGADAVLLGRIERFGAVGASTNFWRAVSNMADVRFNYAGNDGPQSRRYLSAAVSFEVLDAAGGTLWRGESDRWADAASLPPLGDAEEDLYRDLLYAVRNALVRFPGCAG